MYASRTGTRRNLAALRAAGWRLMVSARGVWRTEGFPYAVDNGAWTAYRRGESFDRDAFRRCVWLLGPGADFVVAPDIVAGGLDSLRMSLRWLDWLWGLPPSVRLLVPVQDGMAVEDVEPHLGARVGIFVGGTDAWKERTAAAWGRLARERGAYLHVGRVNTARRIAIATEAGADSVDGSSASRFATTVPLLTRAASQEGFRW